MDELHPKLRSLVAAARDAHDPDEQDAQRVRAALSAALGRDASSARGEHTASAAGSQRAGRSTSPTALAGARGTKWLAVLVIAAGLATITTLQLQPVAPAAPRSHASIPPGQISAPSAVPATSARAGAAPPQADASAAALPAPPAPAPARALAKSARPARKPAVKDEHVAEAAAPAVPSELSLIGNATRALRDGRALESLALLEQHARSYPQGMLRQEQQGLRVLTLCALGRTRQGRAERERFLSVAAHSPLAGRVRAACDGEGTP